jgi:hypothetical protein
VNERASAEAEPPGWYPDPAMPDAWRRWDGAAWRGRPMRLQRGGGIGWPDAMQKALWTTANPSLVLARVLLAIGMLGLIAVIVPVQGSQIAGVEPPYGVVVAIAVSASGVTVLGLIATLVGLARFRRLGGLGSAIWSLWIGVPVLIAAVVVLVLVINAN